MYEVNYKTVKKNKEDWRTIQTRERQQAYDIIEYIAQTIKNDGRKFKEYLDIQSRFEKYSVGNCFLILKQKPDAVHFKDRKSWEEINVKIMQKAKGILILEPNKSEESNKTYYNPKWVYDITQTDAEIQDNKISYEDKELLNAFLYNCYATKKGVDKLPDNSMGTKYDEKNNVLYISKKMGKDTTFLFQSLSQELANIEMRNEEKTDFKEFKSYCISYMMCKKFGIDTSNYDFKRLPDELRLQNSGKEIRVQIESIREKYETINSRIAEYFENRERANKQRAQER